MAARYLGFMGANHGSPFFVERLFGDPARASLCAAAAGCGSSADGQSAGMAIEANADGSTTLPFSALNPYAGRQLRMQLRMIFRLVDQFMRLRRLDFERHRLEGIVQDLLAVVRESFATADLCLPEATVSTSDRKQCVLELEELSRAIGLSQAMPPSQLAHALDSVVVNCVILDSVQRDIEKASLEVAAHHAS
jgi:hypothetical protein